MILGLRCLRHDLFLVALLEKIKLMKEIFVYEVEQRIETFIPADLSQDGLPMSFRFYDPIIALI
jgi:hypothetical protein